MQTNQPKDVKRRVRECKLTGGVNWQGALKLKGIKPRVVKSSPWCICMLMCIFHFLGASSSPMSHFHKCVINFLKMVQTRNMYCKITRTLYSSHFRIYAVCSKYQRKSLLKALCPLSLPVIFH